MEALQQAIQDEKKARLHSIRVYTGSGTSLGCGLTNSTYGWPLAEAEPLASGIVDDSWARCFAQGAPSGELFAHSFRQILVTNYDALIEGLFVSHAETKHGNMSDAVTARSSSQGFRQRELKWRRIHATDLQRYENEWVVLEGEQIISHNSNAAEAVREAKLQGIQTPYVFFVEPQSDMIRIGL